MPKSEQLKILGSRIQAIRKSKGLTQMALAHSIGKDHPSINRLENGKFNPSYLYLLEIAKGLDVDIKDFFE